MSSSAWGLDTLAAGTPDWHLRAACRGTSDPDQFFPDAARLTGMPGAERNAYAEPRAVCASCPVWRPCRAWSLAHDERYGMWGGLTPRQRRRLLKRGAA